MRIAVAGGTGLTGALTVQALERAGHEAVVLARSTGIDLARPHDELTAALADRLTGVDAVVDTLNVVTMKADESRDFFERTTAALLAAGERAGVRHHLVLSIVGIDRAPYDYYVGKLRQEELVQAGSLPWTILRATQFHEFAGQMLERLSFGPVGLAPRMPVQPVAVAEVGEHLARLAAQPARGAVLELAGPAREDLADMARRTARRGGGPRFVLGVPVPGAFGRAVRAGALTTDAPDLVGRQAFAEWLRG
ncbi:NAD(P)H-binding protein [Nocardioides zeae]|uniref:NAD(P)H-binding protein n=1 Tax=Nocardioides imazamoxiresistens TaxID=3231893 RepID=A0ABU3PUF9_9ACTN|nr:NAD(P)H-binding protein [Nocardioides zeae]MDT9592863.1 NAD(P)H-binding protein [Nocardioides zeae]